uniref:Zn(2)-C6 fungal-type domain-containing protein n=1 Tax=Ganoderma boninense TaxID=34458 RepID=A0A5K1K243_9APHY|nr:Zn(2)-C6 fungal-type domain-containing protein [Ganoderma boninense]
MMPHLANLTCTSPDHIPIPLLDAHGKQLESLHFMPYTYVPHDLHANTVLLPRLHELCPRIAHLAFLRVITPEDRTALNIHSPALLEKPSV